MSKRNKDIDTKIEDRGKALVDLTRQLNAVRDELAKEREEMVLVREKQSRDFVERLGIYEKELRHPEVTVDALYDSLYLKEAELTKQRKEVDQFSNEVLAMERRVIQREEKAQETEKKITSLWVDFLNTIRVDLSTQLATIKKRAELLDARNELLDKKQKLTEDRSKSLRMAEIEILKKRHAKCSARSE